MEQLDAIYTVVVVIHGNAEILAEAAHRVAAGELDEARSQEVLTKLGALADQLDRSIPGVPVLEELTASWEQAMGAHADTKEVLAAWAAGEIAPEDVMVQLESVREAANGAATGTEALIAPQIGFTETQMADVRREWLVETIEDAFSPPKPVYACGEGESVEAGASLTGRIAFVSDRDGDPEIYVMNADGSGATRLTDSPGGDYHPVWSPDGTRIAFYSERDGNAEIYVMNADGTEATRLTVNAAHDFDPAWSPDGNRIAFHTHRYSENPMVALMRADGTSVIRLSPSDVGGWSPSWSPDGSRIVFNSSRGTDLDIWVMRADSTRAINVTNGQGDDWWPDWSPVGDQIVFHSARDGNFEIYVMTSAGGALTRLTNNAAADFDPAWSPDGTRVVFTSSGAGNNEVCAMAADGSGLFNVSNHPANDWGADWGP